MINKLFVTFRSRILASFLIVLVFILLLLTLAAKQFLVPTIRKDVKEELANSAGLLADSIRVSAKVVIRNHLKTIAEKNREIARQHLLLVEQGVLSKEEAIARLQAIFLNQRIGSSGYIYCIDSTGRVTVHPHKDVLGSNVTRFAFVREQLSRKEGYLEYDWQNPGEPKARQKALYMVYFKPLDWIISVSSYREEFLELLDLADFREAAMALKFGASGYTYVFDKDRNLLIHPQLSHLADLKSLNSIPEIMDSMYGKNSGTIEYSWQNPGDAAPRKKIASYRSVPEYGWIVVSSAYVDEVMAPVNTLVKFGYTMVFVVFIVASFITYLLSGQLSKPIDIMVRHLDKSTKTGVPEPLSVISNDELGRLAKEFNRFLDLIDRQKKQLQKERETYQGFFETSPDAVILLRGLTIIDCNQATCKIFQGGKSEIVGQSILDLSPPTQKNNVSTFLLANQITEQSAQYNLQTFFWIHQTLQGRLFDAEVRFKPFGSKKGEMLFIAFVRDISELKRAEHALRLTQFIFDKASVAIFRAGAGARIMSINEQACRSLGYSKEELCSMTLFDIDPSLSLEKWNSLKQQRRQKRVVAFESSHRTKDGTIFPVHITSNLLEYEGEQCSISFVRDITEEKKNQKEKARMEAHFQQAQRMEALGTLAGGVAHDFNNILTAIVGYTDLISIASDKNQKAKPYIDQLYAASSRAKNLVQQILIFSKQGNIEKRPTNIGRVLNEAADLIKGSISENIDLYTNINEDLGAVFANETQVHQIIMNLCTNSCHAMGNKQGRLEIDLVPVTITGNDLVNYPDLTEGDYLKIIVSDTGHGIPADELTSIFQPYFTTKPMGEGTGLGLSTVHGIVKDHGGSIKVYSEINVGTTFQILLPLIDSATSTTLPFADIPPQGTETVLYVDNEKYLIDLARKQLESLGYVVETRANSTDALEAFKRLPEKFDVIVCDMTMPELSGLELAAKIKEIRPSARIILCTGFSARLNTDRLSALGIKEILMKPLTLMELATAIRKALDEKRE